MDIGSRAHLSLSMLLLASPPLVSWTLVRPPSWIFLTNSSVIADVVASDRVSSEQ